MSVTERISVMATSTKAAAALRLAEAINGDASDWPILRELIATLTELTELAKEQS
jgi:hypothetical protein